MSPREAPIEISPLFVVKFFIVIFCLVAYPAATATTDAIFAVAKQVLISKPQTEQKSRRFK